MSNLVGILRPGKFMLPPPLIVDIKLKRATEEGMMLLSQQVVSIIFKKRKLVSYPTLLYQSFIISFLNTNLQIIIA